MVLSGLRPLAKKYVRYQPLKFTSHFDYYLIPPRFLTLRQGLKDLEIDSVNQGGVTPLIKRDLQVPKNK